MHAFLIISSNTETVSQKIQELAQKLEAKVIEFPISKIDEVRALNKTVQFGFAKPTLIICKAVHKAGEEALNAFLKNLEEPQENIYFALTSPSILKVLPTIISRCQVIKVLSTKYSVLSTETKEFLNLTVGEKLNYINKIKDRNEAIELAENSVYLLYSQLHSDKVEYNVLVNNLEITNKTLSRLNANGNVNLQLTNFVIHLN